MNIHDMNVSKYASRPNLSFPLLPVRWVDGFRFSSPLCHILSTGTDVQRLINLVELH